MTKPKHLEPSELGTREYWDQLYALELANHAADPTDIGTVWFDDSDAQRRILDFLARLAVDPNADPDPSPTSSPEKPDREKSDREKSDREKSDREKSDREKVDKINPLSPHSSFLDLGSGNGSLLFALRRAGWSGPLCGIDYSARSVSLARQIAASSASGDDRDIRFVEGDILDGPLNLSPSSTTADPSPSSSATTSQTWDVVLDKGTFDAISLSDTKSADADDGGRHPCEVYKDRVLSLLASGGLFLITSCNWTEDELRAWFLGADQRASSSSSEAANIGCFQQVGRIQYPTFRFGGVQGQTISTLCFRKV